MFHHSTSSFHQVHSTSSFGTAFCFHCFPAHSSSTSPPPPPTSPPQHELALLHRGQRAPARRSNTAFRAESGRGGPHSARTNELALRGAANGVGQAQRGVFAVAREPERRRNGPDEPQGGGAQEPRRAYGLGNQQVHETQRRDH